MQLSDIRRLTPITQEYAYFQSSGFSPKMEPVIEETNRWAHFQNAGGAAPGIHEEMLEGFEATSSAEIQERLRERKVLVARSMVSPDLWATGRENKVHPDGCGRHLSVHEAPAVS